MMTTKDRPFTVRSRRDFEERLEVEEQRTTRPRAPVLEDLADEALRMCRFPRIGYMRPESNLRAYLLGTGLEVALGCCREYPEDVDWHVRENDHSPENGHRM
jgi:plasmid stabilization system protein ParE